ncbi:hypothetical protein V8B97DRAFT_2023553 [Scleroderma yunnanense]
MDSALKLPDFSLPGFTGLVKLPHPLPHPKLDVEAPPCANPDQIPPLHPAPALALLPVLTPATATPTTSLFNLDLTIKVMSTLPIRPSDYALKWVENYKHNDTLAITQAIEGNVMVCMVSSLTALKNTKLNHQLTFAEFVCAKNCYLEAIKNVKCGDTMIDALNWFFHNLENHPL